MEKLLTGTLTLLLAVVLVGCSLGAGTGNNKSAQTATSVTSILNASYENALPVQTQLLLGTFKLENTGLAVDSELSQQLIPLWRVYNNLSGSDTAAQEEVNALIAQIEETMTTEQVKAIAAMKLTQQDLMSFMQEQGIDMRQRTSSGGNSSSTPSNGFPGDGFFGGEPPAGGMPPGGSGNGGGNVPQGGGFPPDGMGMDSGQGTNLNPEQLATAQAMRTQRPAFTRLPAGLINALITLLESKIKS